MPITVEIQDVLNDESIFKDVFEHFRGVDERFSTYKSQSEISQINHRNVDPGGYSKEMVEVLSYAEVARKNTFGFFDIRTPRGELDPSGIVKGWAIGGAVALLRGRGLKHFFVDAGGDVAVQGGKADGEPWSVGIKNPFAPSENVKIIFLGEGAIATSGTYIRGNHIYNPHDFGEVLLDVVSLTVVGPSICDADIYATAGFAMGREGIRFIEACVGYEGYQIDRTGIATMTSGFEEYTKKTYARDY